MGNEEVQKEKRGGKADSREVKTFMIYNWQNKEDKGKCVLDLEAHAVGNSQGRDLRSFKGEQMAGGKGGRSQFLKI